MSESDSVSVTSSARSLVDGQLCTHPYQCPNPMCASDFSSRRGLSMHFYHQNNVFCHPPNQLRTQGEIDYPVYFPPELPPLSPQNSASSADDFAMNDDGSSNCWSSSNNSDTTHSLGDDVGPPMEVYADELAPPNVDSMTSKFGISYLSLIHI